MAVLSCPVGRRPSPHPSRRSCRTPAILRAEARHTGAGCFGVGVDVTAPGPSTSPVGGPHPGDSMFTLTPAIRRPVDFDPDATATPYPWPIVVHRGPSVDELRELLACGWIGRAVGERFQMTEGAVRWRARCKS